jgi:hypothetical protein
VANLEENIVLAARTFVPVRKYFTPILKAQNSSAKQNYRDGFERSISVKIKSSVKSKKLKSKKAKLGRNKSCTAIRK